MNKIDNAYKRLVRLDDIRLFKLIEISYYTLISFVLTLITANILENDNYIQCILKYYNNISNLEKDFKKSKSKKENL